MSDRGKLLNVGPKSTAWLRQVGIRTEGELRKAGAVGAFVKVKRAGFRPSLNLLYALEGALTGCHWQQVPTERRAQMLEDVEAAEAGLPPPRGRAAGFAQPPAPVSDVTEEFQAEMEAESGDEDADGRD
ncbi:TfoX/Sxy family protein [Pseudomarimonas salicorniae]|uniref:TfoX/Sxy family protein n=1 Tax=Pseudomarimonas salicorniae TaxID=2933270 RepID=A0ABT0GLG9_9GAMM|nr:TfoX/Sxy family protein [Lysobacter sp. CAU 1642]MCK7595079.1 TfoX/Sxy family protein [Lysobacter sp. CAU 1642]